jgi:RHS repeat-associated protein
MSRGYPTHHSPFGSSLPNRTWSDVSRGYRYGFNGKEKDFETANDNYDFGARVYDGRLGRWLSLDPLIYKYPSLNPFNFASNSPIIFYDPNGKEIIIHYKDESGNNKTYSYNYSPECTPVDNKFVQNTVASLNAIYKGSAYGQAVISYLQNSGKTNIVNSTLLGENSHQSDVKGAIIGDNPIPTYNIHGYDESYGDMDGQLIIWDDLTGGITNSSGCNIRPPASKLIHEMLHSYVSVFVNSLVEQYNELSDDEKNGQIGYDYSVKIDLIQQKYTYYTDPNEDQDDYENQLIINFENIINEEMGWGTRQYGIGVTPHNGAENENYSASSPLSLDSKNKTITGGSKQPEQRTDKQN